jgi:pyruvate carboxylase
MCTINGQLRPIPVRDRAIEPDAPAAEKADPASPGQIAAPFGGSVTPTVALGDQVAAGDTVAKIEAMKMEASITTPVAGTVTRVALAGTAQLDGGDLVLVIALPPRDAAGRLVRAVRRRPRRA